MAGLFCLLLASGCASGNGKVYESVYTDGMYDGTAVLKGKKNGGYETLSGDPVIAVDNGLTTDDQLPYGDSQSGIRTMEDEAAPTGF